MTVFAIVQQAHKRGNAERAHHKHGFIMAIGGQLADFVENRRFFAIFLFGQSGFTHKAVQMLDKRDHNLAQTRV